MSVRGSGRRALALAGALALLPPAGAAAQGWMAELAAGRASQDLAPSAATALLPARVATTSLMAGLRYGGRRGEWLYLSGGVPLEGDATAWGAAGAGGRLLWRGASPLALGVELGADGFGYGDGTTGGGGVTLQALPLVVLQRGRLALELRAGGRQHLAFSPDSTTRRALGEAGGRATLALMPALSLAVDGVWLEASEASYPYYGAGAQWAAGALSAWGVAGRWASDSLTAPVYGAGVALRLGRRAEVQLAWQQEAVDPLYRRLGEAPWSAQRSWTLRLSHALGTPPAPPAVALLPPQHDGRTLLRLRAADAPGTPLVVGDFNAWEPQPMQRSGDFWEVRLALAPGVYHYGFRTAEGAWFLPPDVARVDDGMGGSSAVLVVAEEAPTGR